MRRTTLIVSLIAAAIGLGTGAICTAQQKAVDSVVGTVTDIDKNNGSATIKTDSDAIVSVKTDHNSVYLRISANEKTLAGAVSIQFADIAVGDRVLGHGAKTGTEFLAQRLVVLSRSDIDKKR